MKVFNTIEDMRGWSRAERAAGRRVAFVPTMGALHEGHLSLMREGLRRGASLAVSIYVNPAQFGPSEDLEEYPRTLQDDLAKCEALGADAVFVPTDQTIYPEGFQTYVNVERVTGGLCGGARPGHFRGVATVVAKLLNIVEPDVAIFGEKDYQQLVAIRTMARDLDMPVEVAGCPTVREPDGLAMSSRNKYLAPSERRAALSLYRSLGVAEEMVAAGETRAAKVLKKVSQLIESEGARIDYAEIVHAETLEKLDKIKRPALLALAAFVGSTRLIDNRLFA